LFSTGVQPESRGEIECRRGAKCLSIWEENEWEVVEGGGGEAAHSLRVDIARNIVPPVRDVVACQEHLDLMSAVGPAVSDHSDLRAVIGMGLLPVIEQLVDDRIQPSLRRIPGLEQVIVETDV